MSVCHLSFHCGYGLLRVIRDFSYLRRGATRTYPWGLGNVGGFGTV